MKKLNQIKKIGVAGAGTMGLGIAQISAMAGFETILYDLSKKQLEIAYHQIEKNLNKGIEKGKVSEEKKSDALSRLKISDDQNDLVTDLIVEAIVEKLDIKKSFFAQLEEINDQDSILASNTSSIPITRIAVDLKNPERFIGMHFFNPAHIMKLVEVISGASTDPQVAEIVYELSKKLGKVPVHAKDSPGFIVNRVARHYYVESLKMLEEGVADVETIDAMLESSGFKMGPFKLMDLIGVDTNFSVTQSMFESFHFDSKFRPSRIQQQKADAGHHGKKSGKGFYDYSK
ncbi:MAG: 3-hydroxyacyl-CoA dehydrogenase NAD-binding domain-containing protein [Bacteroidota bacterium]